MSKALGLRKLSSKSNLRGSEASWGRGVFSGGQSFTGYLRQSLVFVFVWGGALREGFGFCFWGDFSSGGIFDPGVGLGVGQEFYEVLRFS